MRLTIPRIQMALENVIDDRLNDMEFQYKLHGGKDFRRPPKAIEAEDSADSHKAALRKLGIPFSEKRDS